MPLNNWASGLSRGISEGLRNVATIRGIQRSQEEEERALRGEKRQGEMDKLRVEEGERAKTSFANQQTTFGQGQEEYKRTHDPTIDPWTHFKTKFPGASDEELKPLYEKTKSSIPGGGARNISLVEADETEKRVLSNPEIARSVFSVRRRTIGTEIAELEKNIADAPAGGGLQSQAELLPYKTKLQELRDKLDRINALDPGEAAVRKAAQEERKVKASEVTAEKTATLVGLRDKALRLPVGSPERVQADAAVVAEEKHELAKTAAGHANELEKARILAGGRDARADAGAKKADLKTKIDTVNKYYTELTATAKGMLTDLDTDDATKAEWRKILTNIPVYHNNDLLSVQRGAEPPNIANLTRGTGGPAEAKPAVRFKITEVTPGKTTEKGVSAAPAEAHPVEAKPARNYKVDPAMETNLRNAEAERAKREAAAGRFWDPIKKKFTYEPGPVFLPPSPRRY